MTFGLPSPGPLDRVWRWVLSMRRASFCRGLQFQCWEWGSGAGFVVVRGLLYTHRVPRGEALEADGLQLRVRLLPGGDCNSQRSLGWRGQVLPQLEGGRAGAQ